MQEKYTKKAFDVLQRAKEAAAKLGNEYIGTEHILLGLTLVQQSVAAKALEGQNVTYHQVMERICEMQGEKQKFYLPLDMTPRAKRVVERSKQEAVRLGANYVGTEHILLALLREPDTLAITLLEDLGVDIQTLYEDIMLLLGESEAQPAGVQGMHERPKEEISETETLDKFSRDMTALAKQGKFDPIVGREQEIERIIRILSRRTKNNPCLMGDPGVGKTAIVEGLAQKISDGNVPDTLRHKRILSLDLSAMVAGSKYRGEFEERMKKALEDVKAAGNIILFIDEIHTVIGAGAAEGAIDASNILKPALARGEIQLIGATTLEEYRKHIEKDSALERRFQPVTINEPSVADSIEILKGIRRYYEDYHGVKISDEMCAEAVKMSERYITDRFLPDKAIDLIDEACSDVNLKDKNIVRRAELRKDLDDLKFERETLMSADAPKGEELTDEALDKRYERIAELRSKEMQREQELASLELEGVPELTIDNLARIIELWTKIPASSIRKDEFERLAELDKRLKAHIVGQDEAVNAVCAAIKRSRVGLKAKRKPTSFIFVGGTGVGKTELVKRLAADLFDSPESLIRLDMSEFMEKFSVSRIIGSPPGYVGYDEAGQLTEKIRRKPYSVVLFDEIEKAHPDVLNILLQILDDGRITDAQGRTVNFENTVIVMTTNAGSNRKGGAMGFGGTVNDMGRERALKALGEFLRPEFINRVDEIVYFNSLTEENFRSIAKLMLEETRDAIAERGISMTWNTALIDYLVRKSYSVTYGARNLRRTIQKDVEDAIAQKIIDCRGENAGHISVSADDNGVIVEVGE